LPAESYALHPKSGAFSEAKLKPFEPARGGMATQARFLLV